jgi:hypothetical protein
VIEENPGKSSQQNADRDPEPTAPVPAKPAPVQPPKSVAAPQQTSSQLAGDSGQSKVEKEIEANEKAMTSFEKKMVPLTWAGLVIAAITGAFLYSQFRIMTDQTKILSDQSISAIAGAIESERNTRVQLETAQKQAKAAQDSVKAVQNAMYQQLRPHVLLRAMDLAIPLQPNTIIKLNNAFENSGQTPALNVSTLGKSEVKPRGEKPDWGFSGTGSKQSIGAHGTYDMPAWVIPAQNETFFKQIMSGDSLLYVLVSITYNDEFHHFTHHSRFCMVYQPQTAMMTGCPVTKETLFD